MPDSGPFLMSEPAKSASVARIDQNTSTPQVISASDGIMTQILRVASDPTIDLDRMDKLMAMHERLQKDQAARAFAAAFADLQADLPVVIERAQNTNTKAKYATLEDTLDAIRPHLRQHGFSINFRMEQPEGAIVVTGILRHREGHEQTTALRLPIDTGAGRNAVQAIGSSETYGRRYVTMALLNIASRTDDDGRAAGRQADVKLITEAQVDQLRDLLQSTGRDEGKFLRWAKLERLEDIAAADFDKAVSTIKNGGK